MAKTKFNGKARKPKASKPKKTRGVRRKPLTDAQKGSIAASGGWESIPE
jgi:hypothetical protein